MEEGAFRHPPERPPFGAGVPRSAGGLVPGPRPPGYPQHDKQCHRRQHATWRAALAPV